MSKLASSSIISMLKLSVAASVAALSLSAMAADKYKWDNNGGDNRMANGDNWYLDGSDPKAYGAPTLETDCEYSKGDAIFLLGGETFTAKKVDFGNYGPAATIDVTNGTFTVAEDVTIGRYGQNAKFNIFDGNVTVRRFNVGHWGSHDDVTLNIYGGDITLTGEGNPWPATLVLGLQTESRGDMFVKGGVVTVNGGVRVGFSNLTNIGGPSASYNSSITVDGGSLSASGTIAVADSDSDSGGGGGRVYVKSGSLSTTGDLNISVTSNSWGQVDITGGEVTVGGTVKVGNHTYAQHAALNIEDGVVNSGGLNIGASSGVDGIVTMTGGAWTNATSSVSIGAAENAVGYLAVNAGEFCSKKMLNIGDGKGSGLLIVGGTGVVRDESSGNDYVRFNGTDGLLRLNKGGKFYFRSILNGNSGSVEFNGGEMIKSSQYGAYGSAAGSTAIEAAYTVKILAGGMIFTSDYKSTFKAGMVCSDGCGGITKRGSGELNFNNQSFEYSGPICVEGGTLTFSGNGQFPEFVDIIRVSEGATLVIPHNVTCRVLENNGTIQGGTVTVEPDAGTKVATKAVWTGAMEDGDVFNSKNYIVYDQNGRIMYEQTITTDTPVVVPLKDGVPSFADFSDVTGVIEDDICSEGYSRPAIVNTAAAWYDPSDSDTVVVSDGNATTIRNKGVMGTTLDLQPYESNAASVSNERFNGLQSIHFTGNSGYRSEGMYPASLPPNASRTLFAVGNGGDMYLISASQNNSADEGRVLLMTGSWGNAMQTYKYNADETKWETVRLSYSRTANNPYVFMGRTELGEEDMATVTAVSLAADGTESRNSSTVYMPNPGNTLELRSYYGMFRVQSGFSLKSNGYQGEALLFTNALSDAEMAEVGAYLKAKWLDSNAMPDFDSLVVNAQVDLGGATRTFETLSGSGSFVDGTVVLTGDLVVTVNADRTVVAPSFDRLVLGENARLVVKGAKYLPQDETINVSPYTSLSGEFKSVVGENGVIVKIATNCGGDHICVRRDTGMRVILR